MKNPAELRGIHDDFAALCLRNLLIVEPKWQPRLPSVQPDAIYDKNKMPQRAFDFYGGVVIFDGIRYAIYRV